MEKRIKFRRHLLLAFSFWESVRGYKLNVSDRDGAFAQRASCLFYYSLLDQLQKTAILDNFSLIGTVLSLIFQELFRPSHCRW